VRSVLLPLSALLAGVALLLSGAGLLGTLVAMRASAEGFADATIGLIASGYFAGFLAGTALAPRLVRRIGHIRAFAFYAAATAALVLGHALVPQPAAWLLLRFATGVALVGLYTVIESWLSAQAAPAQRGQVLAVYMMVNLAALAIGQQLLKAWPVQDFALFALVAMLVAAAVLPVTWTRLAQPELPRSERLGLAELYRRAPAAVAGAGLSGLALSAFWGLAPLFMARMGRDPAAVATFMSCVIVGGAALQLPLGRLSDRLDRRLVLALLSAAAALVALASLSTLGPDGRGLYLAGFAFGGLAFTLYPVAVAHLMDRLPPSAMLSGSSSLLLVHGVGAVLGPLLAGAALGRFGPIALPLHFAACLGALALFAAWRWRSGRPPADQPAHFAPMLRTTPAALEMLADRQPSAR
jgi:MFS family permease